MNRKVLAVVAVLVLAAGAVVFVRRCGDAEDDSKPTIDHRGSASIVGKGRAVPGMARPNQKQARGTLRLEGQVIDEARQPVAHALIKLLGTESTTFSADDGSFAFENLAPRRYRVAAYKGELYAPLEIIRLTETSEPVILRMRRGATFVVHVTSDAGPVVGANLTMDDAVKAVSDAQGVARLGGVGQHFHFVEVTAAGFAPASFSAMLGEDPGGTIERTVVLRRGAPVAGSVVGPDGKPVADATVRFEELTSGLDRSRGHAETDDRGNWRVDAVAAGKYSFTAASDVYGPVRPVVVELDGPKTDLILHVDYDAQVVGTVVDVAGKPVADCATIASASVSHNYQERTDGNGRFEFLGIVAGDYDVLCIKDGLSSRSVRVSVADNERVEVRLVVDDGSIAGVVVDSKGEPVAEAHVTAMPTEGFMMASFGDDTTDSHGRFDLGGLPPGEYLVSATWPDQDERRHGQGERIATGTRNVRLELAAQATIAGRALLDGKPLPYFGLLVTEHPEFSFIGHPTGVRSPDGRFKMTVAPGTWGLVLIAPGTARKIVTDVNVEAGSVTDVGDIVLERGQRVSGHVRDASGQGVAGAQVSIGRPSQVDDTTMHQWFRGEYETTTDTSGGYRFEGIAPLGRNVTVTASHPMLGSSLPVPVPAGDAEIDLVLAATGAIDGLLEGYRSGYASVSVARVDTPNAIAMTEVDATGRFRFEALAPGEYLLTRSALPGEVGTTTIVTVIANQRATARLTTGDKRIAVTVLLVGAECKAIGLTPIDAAGSGSSSNMGFQTCARNKATFQVPAGSYRACTDNNTCASVVVAPSPGSQTVEIRAMP